MIKLKLEIKKQGDETPVVHAGGHTAMFTPPIKDEYWVLRVKLVKDQAILAFPKFGVIGIGFAQEEDWNTNLPSSCPAEQITNHIWHNHKYDEITKEDVTKAIKLIQEYLKLCANEGGK